MQKEKGDNKEGMSGDNENPTDIQKYLAGMDYPADKQAVIDMAEENDAPEDVLEMLNELPEKEYRNPAEVSKEMGK